ERRMVSAAMERTAASSIFPFPLGPLVAIARPLPSGALAYEVFSRGFPMRDDRLIVVEDLAPSADSPAFGAQGRTYVGNTGGLRELERGALDAEAQAQLDRVMARLRASLTATAEWRTADEATSKGHKRRRALEQAGSRQAEVDRDAAQAL